MKPIIRWKIESGQINVWYDNWTGQCLGPSLLLGLPKIGQVGRVNLVQFGQFQLSLGRVQVDRFPIFKSEIFNRYLHHISLSHWPKIFNRDFLSHTCINGETCLFLHENGSNQFHQE